MVTQMLFGRYEMDKLTASDRFEINLNVNIIDPDEVDDEFYDFFHIVVDRLEFFRVKLDNFYGLDFKAIF